MAAVHSGTGSTLGTSMGGFGTDHNVQLSPGNIRRVAIGDLTGSRMHKTLMLSSRKSVVLKR
jgi:hypothetical protein